MENKIVLHPDIVHEQSYRILCTDGLTTQVLQGALSEGELYTRINYWRQASRSDAVIFAVEDVSVVINGKLFA